MPCNRALAATIVTVVLAASAGCGTRLNHAEVVAGAGGGEVRISPETVAQLEAPHRHQLGPLDEDAARVAGIGERAESPGTQLASPGGLSTSVAEPRPDSRAESDAAPLVAGAKPGNAAASVAGPVCPRQLDLVSIGQVGLFSGVAGSITGPAQTALAVWAKDINARGGLHCHPVQLYSKDDGGDPARTAYEVKDLVASHHVVALVASIVVGPGAFHPAVQAARIPAIGGSTGSAQDFQSAWFFPDNPNSVDDLIEGLLHDGSSLGRKRLGVVYCVESTICSTDAKHLKEAAKTAGVEAVYETPASVTQPDYTAPCLNARDAKVDLLAVALDGASIARLARSCDAIGYRPLLATAAAVFSPVNAADPIVRSLGVATVTGEAPWFLDDQPGLASFHAAMARYAPNAESDAASMIAWTSAELFRAAVDNVAAQARSGPITPDLVLEGLGKIHSETLGGLTAPLAFTRRQGHATSTGCLYFELLGAKGWSAPKGSNPVCIRS